jgi:hypothetical protein
VKWEAGCLDSFERLNKPENLNLKQSAALTFWQFLQAQLAWASKTESRTR